MSVKATLQQAGLGHLAPAFEGISIEKFKSLLIQVSLLELCHVFINVHITIAKPPHCPVELHALANSPSDLQQLLV